MENNLFDILLDLDDTPETRERNIIRAPFGYPGSKFKSLDKILPNLPYAHTYVEPFGGSGAVLIARRPSKLEVFNDRYAGVVCFYRCIRDREKLDKLLERLKFLFHSREEFVWCKDTWKNVNDEVERAARWYYMISASFTNQGRAFARSTKTANPVGSKLRNNLRFFDLLHERFKNVIIENQDWTHILKDFDDPDTVFYLDPPYLETFTGMYREHLNFKDHQRLLSKIQELEGFVAISSYPNSLYDSYDWDDVLEWEVTSTFIGHSHTETNYQKSREGLNKATKVKECLYVKNPK